MPKFSKLFMPDCEIVRRLKRTPNEKVGWNVIVNSVEILQLQRQGSSNDPHWEEVVGFG